MITIDAVRMSRKLMYFSSAKARRELGYAARPAVAGLRDEIDWFYKNGYVAQKPPKKSLLDVPGFQRRKFFRNLIGGGQLGCEGPSVFDRAAKRVSP